MKRNEIGRFKEGERIIKKIDEAKSLVDAISDKEGVEISINIGQLILTPRDEDIPKVHAYIKQIYQDDQDRLEKELEDL